MADQRYTTEHLTALHGVSPVTIRTWSMEFKKFLSPDANPGQGKQRLFNGDDMAVIDLVAQYKQDGKTFADIHTALAAGQRGGRPDITPHDLSTMLDTQSNTALVTQNEQLTRRIAQLLAENESLKALERENAALKREIEILREQGGVDEIRRLERMIGRLEYEIEQLKQGNDQKK
ncbi:MAG: hypothetical protein BroJett018_54900 [Chloroflexota bacterium]|nr:MAG: hypothetical protein BroJett018_54900 [Chloroflexota bacterium]